METLLYFLIFGVALVGWGVLSNQFRIRYSPAFELSPNCLLTRKPILFLTGHRSIFYFKRYWNFFPVFLAEHGYEVYHLRLPWTKTHERTQRTLDFLKGQQQIHKAYHLVMDSVTYAELKPLLSQERLESVQSLTVTFTEQKSIQTSLQPNLYPTAYLEMKQSKAPIFISLSFLLHKILCKGGHGLNLGCLGFYDLSNAGQLLQRAVTLAEQDLMQD